MTSGRQRGASDVGRRGFGDDPQTRPLTSPDLSRVHIDKIAPALTSVILERVLVQDIASLGSPDWSSPSVEGYLGTPDGNFGPSFSERGVVKGSPVVPRSSQKLIEEGDMCLYTVTILRGQYQVRVEPCLARWAPPEHRGCLLLSRMGLCWRATAVVLAGESADAGAVCACFWPVDQGARGAWGSIATRWGRRSPAPLLVPWPFSGTVTARFCITRRCPFISTVPVMGSIRVRSVGWLGFVAWR